VTRHRHRSARTDTRPFAVPVSRRENRAAHGCVTLVHTCRCGAVRRLNVNGRHIEAGPWVEPGELREGES
jgi:hypothetical protein